MKGPPRGVITCGRSLRPQESERSERRTRKRPGGGGGSVFPEQGEDLFVELGLVLAGELADHHVAALADLGPRGLIGCDSAAADATDGATANPAGSATRSLGAAAGRARGHLRLSFAPAEGRVREGWIDGRTGVAGGQRRAL